MSETIYATETLVAHQCPVCHIWHGIPAKLNQQMLANRGPRGLQAYCPAGHTWHYIGKSDAEKAREESERLSQELARANQRALMQRERAEHTERRLSAAKGQQTKLKKRIAAGVCPCCQRTFQDLARHMSGQHPDYPAPS